MYLLFIRLNFYLINSDTEIERKKFQLLQFVKYQSNCELRKNYGFALKDAISYNKIIFYLVNITKTNEYLYVMGILFVILRTLIVSFIKLDSIYFISISIPNAFSLLITAAFQINTMSLFYLIFWINCIFIKKYLKVSMREFDFDLTTERLLKKNQNHLYDQLSERNLIRFNHILRLFDFLDKDSNYTISTYYIGMSAIDFLIPYILVLAKNDYLSIFMIMSLSIQTILTTLYTVAHTNGYVVDSVSLHKFELCAFRN